MDVAHEVFCHPVVGDPVEKGIDVETGGRILDGTCVSLQLAVVSGALQVDGSLLDVGGQVYLMNSRDLSDHQRL